jgi:hypothetical protein
MQEDDVVWLLAQLEKLAPSPQRDRCMEFLEESLEKLREAKSQT